MTAVAEPTRRSILDTLLFTSLAATVGSAFTPLPFYLVAPADVRRTARHTYAKSELPPGTARRCVTLEAIVVNDDGIRAFSWHCTHQKSPVNWDEKTRQFRCPLHGAVFNSRGVPLSGPARSALAPVRCQVSAAGDVVLEG